GAANLEVAHVWLCKGQTRAPRLLDHRPVPAIAPALVAGGAALGPPHRLAENAGKSFIGSYVLGLGFVLTPDEARELLHRAPESRAVLFPYINGDDLNRTVDQSPTRWVIDFRDRPLTCPPGQAISCAEDFPACLAIVRERVYPERQRNRRPAYRTYWWHHAEKRPLLYQSLAGRRRVLLRALTSKHHAFAFAPTGWVYDQTCPVYLFDGDHHFALLQSSIHHAWALRHGASLETRPRYTPSDCFETFPFPRDFTDLAELGARYDDHRRALMRAAGEGLTRTYNRFHDPREQTPGIARLRDLHVALDRAVARAYGWSDLDLGHDFHRTAHGLRFTLAESARRELLDRLLALNHARHVEERAAGPHRPG
ncbi:MAG TPA: type IIL restriction-modification enzyme MmeI, partial [Nannocystis sp.]